ncbi:hypothetical protein ACW6U8_12630 [Bacillus subtilis]|uniref:Uncharacterized protein n=2 Tax=Bacillus subtilis TaxID=1423 RepID=A0AC61YUS0_BACIU|nr:hypothetical protein [Bacillus subtilis]KIU12997.1 hypothetical protein SC09_Contig17orf00127 [Bacillus subtilis]MBO3634596.1 hypothetical protein [Bacillus subtilis]MCV2515739.1 hypothetical protein [Bacillus subtilis]MDH3118022.1 hypothetical protein [Bacillus subtilis]MEC0312398.1 hypothetical protein [Bacillus subtilis]
MNFKRTKEKETKLESFDNSVYARTSPNNMPRITAQVPNTKEEQKEIDKLFKTAL